jgi:hypothetical protein
LATAGFRGNVSVALYVRAFRHIRCVRLVRRYVIVVAWPLPPMRCSALFDPLRRYVYVGARRTFRQDPHQYPAAHPAEPTVAYARNGSACL